MALWLTALAVLVSSLAFTAPALAATPEAPVNLAVRYPGASSGLPILSWDRLAATDSYNVEISTSAEFTSTEPLDINTVNLEATPVKQLPLGQLWFRVQGKNATGVGPWSTSSFDRDPMAAPVPTQPSPGEVLEQPDEPALFAWTPLAGVTEYELQISTDEAFTDPALIKTYTTLATSLVLPALQVPTTTYYWRIRGQLDSSSLNTLWSATSSYYVQGLPAAEVVAPDDDINQAVQDAVLSWTAVPGAATYELQISTDSNFLTIAHSVSGVIGTTYARPQTLNNDQYYWRVRPVDASANKVDWSQVPVWQFRRNWPEQPALQYPADNATVGDPFYLQWSPVRLASRYVVEFSPNSSFSPSTSVDSCATVHTTYVPGTPGSCWPAAVGTYYWRVTATDGWTGSTGPTTDGIASEVRRFTYAPPVASLIAPANGETVTVPTLRWEPVAGAARYKVTVTSTNGGNGASITTAATSFTPRGVLDLDYTYRWQVQTVSEDGRLGASVLPAGQRTFTVAEQAPPTASIPQPTGPSGQTYQRFPTLTWTPVVDATFYKVVMRREGAAGVNHLAANFYYPAGEDEGVSYLPPGNYEWYVESYEDDSYQSQSTQVATFTIAAPQPVTGHRAALAGTQLATDSCQASLPNECQNLRQTPILSWEAEPDTGYYLLHLSRDRELTNLVMDPFKVTSTMWMNTVALPDSQAGSAYFWYVQPCRAAGVCGPLEYAGNSFNKQSSKARLTSPAPGATVADAVTLTWEDYLDSQVNPANAVDTPLVSPARIEARQYRVQTATDVNFQNILETTVVDQRQFTSFGTTYPEGPVYWRVQAIDGSNNPLTWSDTGNFVKSSPAVTPAFPAAAATVSGGEAFVWHAQAFAASYDLEVYKNNDQVPNAANLVLTANSKQIGYSPGTPLPASDQSYRWRVRRVDADGRKGRWSALTPFTVAGGIPALTTPLEGVRLSPSQSLFAWEPVPEAATYRYERRLVGGTAIAETVTTPALAWAPKTAMTTGSWEWRVTALDNANKPLGVSPWRGFTVISTPVATSPPVVTGSAKVGTSLTTSEPEWNLPDVTTTYQWFRGPSPIPDATGLVYLLTSLDLNKSISVRASGTKAGFTTGTTTSNSFLVTLGEAPVPASGPLVTGSGQVGSELTLADLEWNQDGVTTSYQWLRDGANISRATTDTYLPTAADIGKEISLKVTGAKTGYTSGTAVSNVVVATAGPAPELITPPSITGTAKVGQILTSTPGTWSSSPALTYQWLRNGVAVTGATKATYTLVTADAGKFLSVRVTARKTGLADGVGTSPGVAVAKLTPTIKGKLAAKQIKATKRGSYTVTLTVAGFSAPAGSITVYVGTKAVKTVKLTAAAKGVVTVRLPLLKKGSHVVKAKYGGTSAIAARTSQGVRLTVTK